jgi:glycosyltransferase involved in cell wall biosynthesis
MKLVIVGPYPLDTNIIDGGVESHIVNLTKGLREINELEVTVISFKKDILEEKIVHKEIGQIIYIPKQRRFGNLTFNSVERSKTIKKLDELKPDIVHFQTHHQYPFRGINASYQAVGTVHGIIHKEIMFEKGMVNWIRRYPQILLEKISLRKHKNIICVSPYAQNLISNLSSARIEFIPNPVSENYFICSNYENPYRILCVCNITKLKNVFDLIKSIRLVKNKHPLIDLHIAGGIKDREYMNAIKQHMKRHDLEENITFLGHLSDDHLLEEYRECSILAHVSLQENSPIVIQQAMAAGKAVVATRVGGVPDLIDDTKSGLLVQCGDIEGLSQRIGRLLRDPNLCKALGDSARAFASQNFRIDHVAQKTYEVYQRIIDEPTALQ